jgi:hypothetical protein
MTSPAWTLNFGIFPHDCGRHFPSARRGQQGRPLGENHQTRLELRLVDIKSADLISLDWNEPHGSVEINVAKFLRERSPGGGILN